MEPPRQKTQELQAKGRAERKKRARSRFRLSRSSSLFRLFAVLGPGLIAANAGNDAGGIATFSQAGASYGYSLLWALEALRSRPIFLHSVPVQYYFAAKVCFEACRMVSVIEALKAGLGSRQKAQVSLFA